MKKVLTLLALATMVGFVSCKKDPKPEPQPEPAKAVTATITANDVTVDEGSTVKIGATTNSSAAISYSSDNTAVATVSSSGEVTGVKAGTANISLKVAAVEGKFTAAEKTIKVTVNAVEAPPAEIKNITIDGDFADWAELADGSFSKTYGDEDATHPALTHCKVYATAEKIFVYIEWDTDQVTYEPDVEHVPFHCYINSDGDASTGGYDDQFSDACSDILTEGWLYDSAGMGSYDPGVYPWTGEPNGHGWGWGEAILPDGQGLGVGAGVEGKYVFSLDRATLAGLGFPVADEFSIGFDIQQNWESVGILPNAAPSEDNPSGVVPSLKVKTVK